MINRSRLLFTFFLFISVFSGTVVSADPLYMWYTSLGETEMYMLGSIHVLSEDFYPLPEFIENLSRRADLLVLEADVSDGNLISQDIIQLTLQKGFYHDGSLIGNYLSENLYESLNEAVNKYNLGMARVSRMKPWLLAITLQTLEMEALGYRAEFGMEQIISEMYTGDELIELEGAEYQLDLISGLPEEEQLDLLISVLEESGNMKGSLELYVDAWKSGNPDLITQELEGLSGVISERLLIERNISMAEKAGNLLRTSQGEQTILFVVGAAHFTGVSGILSRMSDQGFQMKQVDNIGELILK